MGIYSHVLYKPKTNLSKSLPLLEDLTYNPSVLDGFDLIKPH